MVDNALNGFYDGIKPIPVTLVCDWADANRYLTSDSAAEPGKWHTSRTPYLREPINFLSPNSPGNEAVIQKGHQLGFTEAALNLLGCYIAVAPCPMMYVMPTLDNAKDLADSRFEPMVKATPSLAEKIRPNRERDSGNTKLMKKFAGGFVKFPGANSAASLASKAIRVAVFDEIDRYPLDVDGEGSPIKLGEKRQSTFGLKKKTLKFSTPGTAHTSQIEPAYLKTDQRKYFIPCPHENCGHYQELRFAQLIYDATKIEEGVVYECEKCGQHIEERFKTWMLDKGEWRVTCPENISPYRRGYHINSLYSPIGWLSWIDIAKDYEDSKDDQNKLKAFVNTILGETWKELGEVPQWENIYNRSGEVEPNKLTNETFFITAGVDVQGDRLEVHLVGWGKNRIKHSIDYRVLVGSPSEIRVWNELAQIVNETWTRPDTLVVPVRLMAIDTGGHHSAQVYNFCRRFDATKVIPIKGSTHFDALPVTSPKIVDTSSAGKKIGRMKVWMVGVSAIKSEVYSWLKLEKTNEAPPGFFYFPRYPEHFFKGITAEQLQTSTNKAGFKVYEWVKTYRENEPLDTTVYARAAASVVGIDRMKDAHFDALVRGYGRIAPAEKKQRPKSKFWD